MRIATEFEDSLFQYDTDLIYCRTGGTFRQHNMDHPIISFTRYHHFINDVVILDPGKEPRLCALLNMVSQVHGNNMIYNARFGIMLCANAWGMTVDDMMKCFHPNDVGDLDLTLARGLVFDNDGTPYCFKEIHKFDPSNCKKDYLHEIMDRHLNMNPFYIDTGVFILECFLDGRYPARFRYYVIKQKLNERQVVNNNFFKFSYHRISPEFGDKSLPTLVQELKHPFDALKKNQFPYKQFVKGRLLVLEKADKESRSKEELARFLVGKLLYDSFAKYCLFFIFYRHSKVCPQSNVAAINGIIQQLKEMPTIAS